MLGLTVKVFVKNLNNEIQVKYKFKYFSKTILFCENFNFAKLRRNFYKVISRNFVIITLN